MGTDHDLSYQDYFREACKDIDCECDLDLSHSDQIRSLEKFSPKDQDHMLDLDLKAKVNG